MPKLLVMYPPPTDVATFDKRYKEEHLPMAGEHLQKVTKLSVLAGIMSPGTEKPAYHTIAMVEFASMDDLKADLGSEGGQKTAAHAVEISTGGAPVFLVCEDAG